jgi:glucose-6-phosphate 1-dehydrogenase
MTQHPENLNYQPEYRMIGACEIEVARPFCLIIFGASGDLAKRKLIPSLYHLFIDNLLPDDFCIFCTDRVAMDLNQYRDMLGVAIQEIFPDDFKKPSWDEFSKRLYYSSFDYSVSKAYKPVLINQLPSLEKTHNTGGNRIFYLAIPPTVFEPVIDNIGALGLGDEDKGHSHIVIEKPFGRDINSASRLNMVLKKYFREEQIFRIDHYIAKETVQNMLMFRFANSIFEPLWNRSYIDHIQITVAETIGIDQRAGYYEEAGILRDMFQSHMLQLLAITAMEPPSAFKVDRVRDEKIKVFRSIRPFQVDNITDYLSIGQYGKGSVHGKPVPGYREEKGVSPKSITPTFAAMKVFIDNWRWNGVPFYLRSGKRLPVRKSEISIHFKQVPHMMFSRVIDDVIDPNILIFRLQPDEGISLTFQTKKPGTRVCLNPVLMDFSYQRNVHLDAYEWVLLDCILGQQMLFLRQEGVELTWSLLTPAIEKLESVTDPDIFPNYPAGSPGPENAKLLMERDGRSWRPVENEQSIETSTVHKFRGHLS